MKYEEKSFSVPVQVNVSQERWDSIFKVNEDVSGVAAFFGTWPGDETDEELLRLLKDID